MSRATSETRARIRVVNPNSNEAVTHGLDAALEPLRFAGGPDIVCHSIKRLQIINHKSALFGCMVPALSWFRIDD